MIGSGVGGVMMALALIVAWGCGTDKPDLAVAVDGAVDSLCKQA